MKIGSLVTWKVDKEEFLELKNSKNPNLEVGILVDVEFKSNIKFACIMWIRKDGRTGIVDDDINWAHLSSLSDIGI
jgi:hypothetical protein